MNAYMRETNRRKHTLVKCMYLVMKAYAELTEAKLASPLLLSYRGVNCPGWWGFQNEICSRCIDPPKLIVGEQSLLSSRFPMGTCSPATRLAARTEKQEEPPAMSLKAAPGDLWRRMFPMQAWDHSKSFP